MSYSSHLLATTEQVSAMRLWLTCSYCALSDSGAHSVFNRLAGLAGCKKGGVYRECVRYTFRQLQPTPPTVNMHLVTYYVVTVSKIIITNKTNLKTNRRVEEWGWKTDIYLYTYSCLVSIQFSLKKRNITEVKCVFITYTDKLCTAIYLQYESASWAPPHETWSLPCYTGQAKWERIRNPVYVIELVAMPCVS